MSELLFEILSEEIPARMQLQAEIQLNKSIQNVCEKLNLQDYEINVFSTPRRLGCLIKFDNPIIAAYSTEFKGPKLDANENAINGFKNKILVETHKGAMSEFIENDGYLWAIVRYPEQQANVEVASYLSNILSNFYWPKSMRWEAEDKYWVRPLRNLLCITEKGDVCKVNFGSISSSNHTYLHPLMGGDKLLISTPSEYFELMKKHGIILEREQRKEAILDQIRQGIIETLIAKRSTDTFYIGKQNKVVEEVVGLTERPTASIGEIPEVFMTLPPEVLETVMITHQRYIPIYENGMLTPFFAIVHNSKVNDINVVMNGHYKVLKARFNDAIFFFEVDIKKGLKTFAKELKSRTYHEGLGTLEDKARRIKILAEAINEESTLKVEESRSLQKLAYDRQMLEAPHRRTGAYPSVREDLRSGVTTQLSSEVEFSNRSIEAAASLCKADLLTNMVNEFPELQGIMGGIYALKDNLSKEVATAIKEHYMPIGAEDMVPSTELGALIATADKLDQLIAFFSKGLEPTGSKDPFALKRACFGLIRIIKQYKFRFNLDNLLSRGFELLLDSGFVKESDNKNDKLVSFIIERVNSALELSGIKPEVISAAHSYDNIRDYISHVETLNDLLQNQEAVKFIASYNRVISILEIAEKENKAKVVPLASIKADKEALSINLYHKISELQINSIEDLFVLSGDINEFFDKVIINHEDINIKGERLGLLSLIRSKVNPFGSLEKMAGIVN